MSAKAPQGASPLWGFCFFYPTFTNMKTLLTGEQIAHTTLYSVSDVAQKLNLTQQPNGNWNGAPVGTNATKDGFILCPDGNAFTNSGDKYDWKQVAELAGIAPDQYEPFATWKASKPATKTATYEFDWKLAKIFDYTDEKGNLLYQVLRIGSGETKKFSQRKPDGNGKWINNLDGVRRVLYKLPEVLKAQTIFICEGEKAAEALNSNLIKSGLYGDCIATTNPMGALKWRDEYAEALDGKLVYVLPDNNMVGFDHAIMVCDSIDRRGKAIELKRVDLPNLPDKGDVADWLASGGDASQILDLAFIASQWEPRPQIAEISDENLSEDKDRKELRAEIKPRWAFTSLSNLRSRERPNWLIQDVLVETTAAVASGDSQSFKTFTVLDMGLSVASGLDWHGRKVKRGPVVYIAAEGGWTLRDRLEAWEISKGIRVSDEDFLLLEVPVAYGDKATIAEFSEFIQASNPVLVIIDTLSACAEGLKENASEDMATFVRHMKAVATATGAANMVIHHNNKGGDMRGAVSLKNDADTHLTFERSGVEDDLITIIKCSKHRGAKFSDFALQGEKITLSEPDKFGRDVTSLVFAQCGMPEKSTKSKADTTQEKLLEVLRQCEADNGKGVTFGCWRDAVLEAEICKPSAFNNHRKELLKCEKVVQDSSDLYHIS